MSNHINFSHARYERSYGTASQLPAAQKPEVVICGRSNVGKSSLINALFSRKNLALTSSKPGKTATINFYEADGIYLVDLPGYGFARANKQEKERWAQLIEGYFTDARSINLAICLIDMRHEPQPLDYSMLHFLQEEHVPYLVAFTKADKIAASKHSSYAHKYAGLLGIDSAQTIVTSAQTKEGIQQLQTEIEAAT